MRIALSIAGSDPTGGAGLQLDLQVFRALGLHGAGVPTALTVQDTRQVHRVLPVFPSLVLDQIRRVIRDLPLDAVKLGMLASDDVARSVSLGLEELRGGEGRSVPLVLDPVLAASDGTPLLERRAWKTLSELVSFATLVTPNLPEAEALSGHDVSSTAGVEAAARFLIEDLRAEAALVKGGHADGPPDDLLGRRGGSGVELRWLPGKRIEGGPVHGTGCALASAITAALAKGEALEAAVAEGRRFVADAIARSVAPGNAGRLLVY